MKHAVVGLIGASLIGVLAWTHGSVPGAAAAPPRAPVVVIVMENHTFVQIMNDPSASYLDHTFVPSGTLFSNYSAVTHPSLPNYLAMVAGSPWGCHTDSCPPDSFRRNNLFLQLDTARIGWEAWDDSMPSNCFQSNSGNYVVRHNPAVYFTNVVASGSCAQHDVGYPSKMPGTLPPFTFITPNVCHDMHSCSVATGDSWLSHHVPALLGAGAIVIITFDEGTVGSNRVLTAVSGPGVPAGSSDASAYSHYGLLAGLENYFGLTKLKNAATANPLPI
jgi:hypothetical protein